MVGPKFPISEDQIDELVATFYARARVDPELGPVFMTAIGIWFWEPMSQGGWLWMALLCVSGVSGHWLLIKCYEMAEASAVQPFAYFHLIWAAMLGMAVFGEVIRTNVAIGAGVIIAAGLFTLWRERMKG